MKKTYILLATLFTVCFTLPAMAQSPLADSIFSEVSREVSKSLLKLPAKKSAKKEKQSEHAICTACGNPITTDHQHCPATDNTALCTTHDATENTRSFHEEDLVPSICPICGHVYSIDEKYHGVEHVCPDTTPTCAACGEEIVTSYQHCPATNYTGLCTPAHDEHASHDQQAPTQKTNGKNKQALQKAQALWEADLATNGHPEHSQEYYYEQVISGKMQ